ncbi:hypothetical protein PIIN_04275 [Serendipita indica DSM 11827]|uniref:Uncharacterized protein n=1 Tax=Serendipita indica (strain DSM 11827) TaxID=1109443 RepID=G4TG90_SERID|nr:hypothetical protein PIIN_04275 [Serendipita indica DSM 11827]
MDLVLHGNLLGNDNSGPEDNLLLFYYALARALRRGDAGLQRPALPIRVVSMIFDHLNIKKSVVEQTDKPFSVTEKGRPEHMGLQIDARYLLASIGRLHLQLTTKSHDQGWVDNPDAGNWTWFEVFVQKGGYKSDEVYCWKTHNNKLGSYETSELEGPIFDPVHPIWSHLDVGDIIGARAKASFVGWVNHVEEMKLEIWEPFDPTRFC